jgi:hypothetical protein
MQRHSEGRSCGLEAHIIAMCAPSVPAYKNEERGDGRKCVMSTNIPPRLCDAPTAPCDSAGHRKGSSKNTDVEAARNSGAVHWAAGQSLPETDLSYRLNRPVRAQANVQAHAETGQRRKLISYGEGTSETRGTPRVAARISLFNCIQEQGVCREPAPIRRGRAERGHPEPR